jgi:hypothetical protein
MAFFLLIFDLYLENEDFWWKTMREKVIHSAILEWI